MRPTYEIYKLLKYGYFTWIANERSRARALKKLASLRRETADGSAYVAVARSLPSLLAITPVSSLR